MSIFIDTAAFLAVLNVNDRFHAQARNTWSETLLSDQDLFTSNYVILETTALLQHRFGLEALRVFENEVLPAIEITWVDRVIHDQGMSALLAANRRDLSLVDCTSFLVIRQTGIENVFTFDSHFREQGFNVIPEN
jgi:predicted nucleic acid-binding protein